MNHSNPTSDMNLKKQMSARVKQAKLVAESNTHRRRIAPIKRDLENKLMKEILAQSFALQILRNSEVPASQLLREMRDVEEQSGKFLIQAFEKLQREPGAIDLQGMLNGVFSFLQLGRPPIPAVAKPFMASLKQRTIKFLLRQLGDANMHRATSKSKQEKSAPKVPKKRTTNLLAPDISETLFTRRLCV